MPPMLTGIFAFQKAFNRSVGCGFISPTKICRTIGLSSAEPLRAVPTVTQRPDGKGCAVDDAVDYHSAVGDALMILIDGLTPFVQRVTSAALPPGVEWTELLRQKDAASGRRTGVSQR